MPSKIAPTQFFAEWKGHHVADLEKIHSNILSIRGDKPIVWLAGDSSLDNKAWLSFSGPGGVPLPCSVPDIYTSLFKSVSPMKPDIAFLMNDTLRDTATCINTAVEASLLRDRKNGQLLPQDRFLRDNLRPQDILIVSIGGNDIALSPTTTTTLNMLRLIHLSSLPAIHSGNAGGLAHFKRLFGPKTQTYISHLVAATKPAAVLVCMIYFPLESGLPSSCSNPEEKENTPSWADPPLKALKYDTHPAKLQSAIRAVYEHATRNIRIDGTTVIPVPLFDVLDPRREAEYVERVEPSVEGGRKMVEALRGRMAGYLGGKCGGEEEEGRERVDSKASERVVPVRGQTEVVVDER